MYGVPLNKARARELFDRMDASDMGDIQIKNLSTRCGSLDGGSNCAVPSCKSEEKQRERWRGQEGVAHGQDKVDPHMTVEEGKIALRRIMATFEVGPQRPDAVLGRVPESGWFLQRRDLDRNFKGAKIVWHHVRPKLMNFLTAWTRRAMATSKSRNSSTRSWAAGTRP